jgi:dsDNA-specific endonuclease/ATPase MutS2
MRRTVHTILERLPEVASFRLAMEDEGGWGATIVSLKPDIVFTGSINLL